MEFIDTKLICGYWKESNVGDFNINVETYNVKTVEEVVENYNVIQNFKNKPVKERTTFKTAL